MSSLRNPTPACKPRVHVTAEDIEAIERLILRIERAASTGWRQHPVLGSDADLAARYLRKLLAERGTL